MQVATRARQIRPGGTGLIALLVGTVLIVLVIAALVFNATNDGTKATTRPGAPATTLEPVTTYNPMAGQRDVTVALPQPKAQYNPGSGEGMVGGGSREALQGTITLDRLDRIEMNRLRTINTLPGDTAASATPRHSLVRDRFIEANTILPTASNSAPPEQTGRPR